MRKRKDSKYIEPSKQIGVSAAGRVRLVNMPSATETEAGTPE
jgi:hypothetical protein